MPSFRQIEIGPLPEKFDESFLIEAGNWFTLLVKYQKPFILPKCIGIEAQKVKQGRGGGVNHTPGANEHQNESCIVCWIVSCIGLIEVLLQ